jgi:polyhydroxyalkanoate synthesis regulator phasin
MHTHPSSVASPETSVLKTALAASISGSPTQSAFSRLRANRFSRRSLVVLGSLLVASLLSIGCSPNPSNPSVGETPAAKQERLVREAFAIQDQATKLLFGITDRASAEAAMGGLDQLKSQVVKLVGEVKQAGEMTPETRQRVMAEVEKRKAEIQQQVAQFAGKLMTQPQLLQALQPVIKKVDELRQAFDGVLK